MKKLFLLTIASLALVSCGKSLESKARKQMEKTMLEMARNPDALKISDIETSELNDTLCILSCKVRGENMFGGYDVSEYQYYYLKDSVYDDEVYYENIIDVGKGCRMNRFASIVMDAYLGFNTNEDVSYEYYTNVKSPSSDYNKAAKFLVYGHRNDSIFINKIGDELYLSVHNIAVQMICKTFGREVK